MDVRDSARFIQHETVDDGAGLAQIVTLRRPEGPLTLVGRSGQRDARLTYRHAAQAGASSLGILETDAELLCVEEVTGGWRVSMIQGTWLRCDQEVIAALPYPGHRQIIMPT
jgi:hypothetical protein